MKIGGAFVFILLSLMFQILSLIFGKSAALRMPVFSARTVMRNGYYLASLACLGLQALCWPLALRHFPLFWSYLFMSGIYVAIPVVSRFVYKEKVTFFNVLGSVIIMAGIVIMFLSR